MRRRPPNLREVIDTSMTYLPVRLCMYCHASRCVNVGILFIAFLYFSLPLVRDICETHQPRKPEVDILWMLMVVAWDRCGCRLGSM